ncbi:MAG: flagellin [Selenomonadaceae bacterium]|nr:flagellin [Selenomonadaceae bacterium]MBR1859438.1 flagellin [Selenomonadaceae bacterium]
MAIGVNGVNSSLNNLNRIHNASQNTLQRIATGSKYSSASQGASQYAISQRMYNNIGSIGQSIQNTQNVNAMLQTASGAANNTVQALSTIRESLINAANGTNNDSDRSTLQQNINQMIRQIDDNAGVQYNGQRLLDGSRNITVAGITGYENVNVGNLTSRGLGLTDDDGNVTINVNDNDSIQSALDRVGTALESAQGTADSLSSAQENNSFDAALDEVTTLGAQQQRLEYQAQNYATMEENELNAVSNLNDTDIAREVTNLRSQQTQEQLALYATKMFNQNRASVLNLLS